MPEQSLYNIFLHEAHHNLLIPKNRQLSALCLGAIWNSASANRKHKNAHSMVLNRLQKVVYSVRAETEGRVLPWSASGGACEVPGKDQESIASMDFVVTDALYGVGKILDTESANCKDWLIVLKKRTVAHLQSIQIEKKVSHIFKGVGVFG